MTYLEGILTGLATIVFIGPVLFTLLQASMQHGPRGGMMVATGIIASDIIAVGLCMIGAIPFFENPANKIYLAIAGAVILFGMGLKYILRPAAQVKTTPKLDARGASGLFVNGFLVNFVNPFVFVIWIGLIGLATERYGDDYLIYLSGVLTGVYITDLCKAYFASKLRKWMEPKRLRIVYQVMGILMLIFSVRLIWYIYQQ